MKPVKKSALSAVRLFPFLVTAFMNQDSAAQSTGDPAVEGNHFAVLELFILKGCSSYPAADKLLASIQKNAGTRFAGQVYNPQVIINGRT